ncbi:Crp/Fnr family transcriptional regulator [Flavobacterium aquidurense]|uniref:Crp/Fnr family transcriptional regulator n=1 Tax=Flavobacterium aquidurense TaxID=362413 RepID=UPI0037567AC3
MEKLKSALAFGGILTALDIDLVASHFSTRELKQDEYFQELDKTATEIAFVKKGILRIYGTDGKGNDVTKFFVRERQFFSDIESYYAQQPSSIAIQAVVGSELLVIKNRSMETLTQEIPNLFIFQKSITGATLLNKIKDNDFLNFGNAKTKYLEFLKRYPELVRQVPQHYIASYLKITPQSLSRIRNEIMTE